jgi:recombination protein RecT
MTTTAIVKTPIDKLKVALSADSIQEQLENALQENRQLFIASIIELVVSDKALQECAPGAIIAECLKAATLDLPLNKTLGHAYVIPYKIKGVMTPQFQMGYKGWIQLAMRSGKYLLLNASVIHEGYQITEDILTGEVKITGEQKSSKVIGYSAYLRLTNGFSKGLYMSTEKVIAHAKRFSRSFTSEYSPWKTDFDSMALKTVIKKLLSRYGVVSIKMQYAAASEEVDEEENIGREIQVFANKEELEIPQGTSAEPTGEKQMEAPF